MKRIAGLFLLFLLVALPLHATNLTGTIKLANGSNLTGKLRLTLSQPAHSVAAGAVVVPGPVNITVTNGALTGSPTVYGNDDLEPSHTYYWAEYFNTAGTRLMEQAFYISGASFDIGAARPTTITTSNISYVSVPAAGTCPAGQYATATTTSGVTCAVISMPSTFLTGSATLDFPEVYTLTSSDLTISVPGAAVGDPVALGMSVYETSYGSNCFTAWVSAPNTVAVRFNNYSSGTLNPDPGLFKVVVIK
jgi:hypothetical protein